MSYFEVIPSSSPSQKFLDYEFEYQLVDPLYAQYEMQDVWQLAANNLIANGDVTPVAAMHAVKDPDFDFHALTRVVNIRHREGLLVGTFSITLNSEQGMPVSRYFREEIYQLCKSYRLINGWRFSMSRLSNAGILRIRTMSLFKQLCWMTFADAFVIYYNKRLQRYYDRQFNGRVIGERCISFDGENRLPVRLMLCEAIHNQPNLKIISQGAENEHSMDIE